MEMGCKVPAPVFWSQMTVYLLLLSHYWVYWKIFAVKSGNYNWVLTLNPRGQILRMNAPRKALIAWDFGDKMIALDTPRHPSTLALTSLELARSLPAKLEGGKRVASSDLRVHVPRMGTSSQSSLYGYMYMYMCTCTSFTPVGHDMSIIPYGFAHALWGKYFGSKKEKKKKSPVSGVRAHCLRPACQHFWFFFATCMKRCSIPAKIAVSIGIPPWMFAWFLRLLLAT